MWLLLWFCISPYNDTSCRALEIYDANKRKYSSEELCVDAGEHGANYYLNNFKYNLQFACAYVKQPDTWVITWFCLNLADRICRNLDGRTGSENPNTVEMCDIIAEYGTYLYRVKYQLQLDYVCSHVVDQYRPAVRPSYLESKK
jgi:hypothetical protein